MTHPSKARDRWAPYLAFLWRVERWDVAALREWLETEDGKLFVLEAAA